MQLSFSGSNQHSVSVIITTHNSREFLSTVIESVLSQTYSAVEIIVVDDGSTDDTKVVCDLYPELIYIYQAHQGAASARNTGIGASQGEYVVFLDRDDCLVNIY